MSKILNGMPLSFKWLDKFQLVPKAVKVISLSPDHGTLENILKII